MVKIKHGQEKAEIVSFIERTLSLLAEEKYNDFLAMYDSSRISRDGLLLALRYLDVHSQIVKIDDPMKAACNNKRIDIGQYKNGSGYWVDYDLTTDGRLNDLTIQVEFLKQGAEYFVILEDLHTL